MKKFKGWITTLTLATVLSLSTVNADGATLVGSPKADEPCTQTTIKTDTTALVTRLIGIIVGNLTGIIVGNVSDAPIENCGIIVGN